MVVVDQEAFRRLPGSIALYRAAQAMAIGDVAGTMTHARRALDLVGEDDQLGRGAAAGLLGLVAWTSGDLEAAHRSYAESMANLQEAGHVSTVIGCAIVQADIRIAQGRLRDAMRTYERGLQLATEHGAPALRGAADMHTGMSELFRERNDLETASQHLLMSRELGEENGLSQNPYRSRVAAARIRQAQGDPRWRARAPRRGRAPVCERLLPRCAPRRRREGEGVDRPGEPVGGVGLGAGAWCRGRGRAQLPPRVRARHAGEAAPGAGDARPCRRQDRLRRSSSRSACSQLRRTVGAAGARSTSSSCRRSPVTPATIRRVRSPRWRARWPWLSQRATSASSSTKGRPWRRC